MSTRGYPDRSRGVTPDLREAVRQGLLDPVLFGRVLESSDADVDADETVVEPVKLNPAGAETGGVDSAPVHLVVVDGGRVGDEFDAGDDAGDHGRDVVPVSLDLDASGQG